MTSSWNSEVSEQPTTSGRIVSATTNVAHNPVALPFVCTATAKLLPRQNGADLKYPADNPADAGVRGEVKLNTFSPDAYHTLPAPPTPSNTCGTKERSSTHF